MRTVSGVLALSLLSTQAAAASLEASAWGTTPDGQSVSLYTLRAGRLAVRVSTYGALLVAIETPDISGHADNIVLGFDDLHGYIAHNADIHFGAFIGRVANRIAHARFTLDGRTYHLQANDNGNTLHSGQPGFDRALWRATPGAANGTAASLTLLRTSPDGEQGFPGALDVAITYTLSADSLRLDYAATPDADTVVNFTNHSYFNLAGDTGGTALDTVMQINASRYTPTDAAQIPTGALNPVAGTPLDFRTPMPLGTRVRSAFPQLVYARGYDNNWVLDKKDGELSFAARAWNPRSGRVIDVFTTQPGLQVYTANSLNGAVVGAHGTAYRQGDAFMLETQHFPDSPNHSAFPSIVLKKRVTFRSVTIFRFGVAPSFPSGAHP